MVVSRQHMSFEKYETEFFARHSVEIKQTFFLHFERKGLRCTFKKLDI